MSLNPFEVRLKVLEMSKDYLDQMYAQQIEISKMALKSFEKQGNLTEEFIKKMMPSNYSVSDVLDKANELYSFVKEEPKKSKSN